MNYIKIKDRIGNAYGHYPERSIGRLMNTLLDVYRLPMRTIDGLCFGHDTITERGNLIGRYRWFDDNFPVVQWLVKDYEIFSLPTVVLEEGGRGRPFFLPRLSASIDMSIELKVFDPVLATPELITFIQDRLLTKVVSEPGFKAVGHSIPDPIVLEPGRIYIRFWGKENIIDVFDFINEHFTYPKMGQGKE